MRIIEIIEGKEKGLDGKACWKGYKIGSPKTKMKGGKRVDNCVPVSEDEYTVEVAKTERVKVDQDGLIVHTTEPDKKTNRRFSNLG